MSLHRYFKANLTLPTTKETGLSPRTLVEAIKSVEQLFLASQSEEKQTKKRKYTTTFTPKDRADIGRYAAENGNLAAVKKLKADFNVGESTVRVFKKKYLLETKKDGEFKEVTSLPTKKLWRKLMLGKEIDGKVQEYVTAIRKAGTPIGSSLVMAASNCIIKTLLFENGGHILITRDWALSLLGRMGYVKRKATMKSTPRMSEEQFQNVRAMFLKQIAGVATLRKIPDSLIINIDQTGDKLVPTGNWTKAAQGGGCRT